VTEPTALHELHQAIWDTLTAGPPVVLTSHVRLDGDAAGSVLALWHGLKMRGVEAYAAFQPPVPDTFDFMPGMGDAHSGCDGLPEAYNLAVIDCGRLDRVGELADGFTGKLKVINIDHHATNTCFGDLNWVRADASSCGEMMLPLLRAGGVPLTAEIAECLFAAIVCDTGRFSYEDIHPDAFAVCGECVRAGARPDRIMGLLFALPSPAQVKLQQMALATLRFYCGGRIATMDLTREMFAEAGLQPIDSEGFANLPVSIQGVQASALLREMPGTDIVKVSMRSRNVGDVCAVARHFGGGGHVHAAGCEIAGSLPDVRRAIVERLMLLFADSTETCAGTTD